MTTNQPLQDDSKNLSQTADTSSNYQIRPSLNDSFKIESVKGIIDVAMQQFLEGLFIRSIRCHWSHGHSLAGKSYSQTEAATWTKQISDEISRSVQDLNVPRYKHVVQVMMAQKTGAGCRYIARCRWDAECDSKISKYFTNDSIICVVTVFGIYLY